jgi:transposase
MAGATPLILPRLSKAPIAAEAVKRIDALFAFEREINCLSPHERLRARYEHSRPLIVELQARLRKQRAKLSRSNDMAKARKVPLPMSPGWTIA